MKLWRNRTTTAYDSKCACGSTSRDDTIQSRWWDLCSVHKFTLSRNWRRTTNVSHVTKVHQQDIMRQLGIDLARLPTNVTTLCLSWCIRFCYRCLCCMWNIRCLLSFSYLCQFVNWTDFIFLTAGSISFFSYSAILLVFKKGHKRFRCFISYSVLIETVARPHS